jgi:non-specific serine/threonine protein kinase/serine/threonine-protein kinase
MRRHRLAFTAGGAVAAALVLGIVLSLWALMQAREQRALADGRSAELGQVVAFQQRMLEDLDLEAMGATLQRSLMQRHSTALSADGLEAEVLEAATRGFEQSLARAGTADAARELLNTRVLQPALLGIERDFADQPLLAAALLASLGGVQFNLGLFAESAARHGAALEIRERELGSRHPDTIASRYSLGTALTRNARLDDAQRELDQALQDARATLSPNDELPMSIEQQLAQSLSDAGRLAEARGMQESLVVRAEQQHGTQHVRSLSIRNNLGITLIKLGEYRLALDQYEHIVPLRVRLLGETHRDTMASMSNLAALRGNLGDLEGALALQERLQTLLTERLGAEHPSTLSQANNAATTLFRMGRSDEARQRMERVVDLRRKVLGETHSETLRAMHNLASSLNLTGESERSLELMREVHALRSRSLGAEHPDTLGTRANFASVLRRLERNAEALAESESVLEARRRVLGASHPDTLASMEELSGLLSDMVKSQAAEQIARQALELAIERHQDDAHPAVRRAAITYFARLHGVGGVAAAEAVFQRHVASLVESEESSLSPQDRALRKRLHDTLESLGISR